MNRRRRQRGERDALAAPFLTFFSRRLSREARDGAAAEALSAAQIAGRVAEVYATCASYADTGRYRDLHGSGTLSTAFVCPDRFRFEYEVNAWDTIHDRILIWRDGRAGSDGGTAEWRSRYLGEGDEEEEEVLRLPLGETLPGGMKRMIPALLFAAEVTGDALDLPGGLRRLNDARLDGREGQECFRIAGETRTVWIDKGTFLVRRIADPGYATSYDPILNGEVTDDMLRHGW